jgi:hypothetical protein
MDGVLFLASVIATGLVMWWVWQNDREARDRADRGLFALRQPPSPASRRRAGGPPPPPPR